MSSHSQSTFTANQESAEKIRGWFVIDATDKPLGRLASEIARVLRGKHKPTFTPHVDTGDFVVVVNANKVLLTGNKLDQKKWQRHSGIPGGFKENTYRDLLVSRPTLPIEKAVKEGADVKAIGRQSTTAL